MSPDERAENVCSATNGYRQRQRHLSELNEQIAAKQTLLARGYRVYESCQLVNVTVPGKAVDCGGLSGTELQNCQKGNTSTTTETRRLCREVPVPIDFNYEARVLSDLQMSRDSQLENHELETELCLSRAKTLSADDAYLLYKSNSEP
jgi:hypothetical protein